MKVLFPQPDSPTRATDSDGLIFKVSPLKTKSSFLVGYLNQTFSNSISPFTLVRSSLTFSDDLSSAKASIGDGDSIRLKTLSIEASALPSSGYPAILPAAVREARKKIIMT